MTSTEEAERDIWLFSLFPHVLAFGFWEFATGPVALFAVCLFTVIGTEMLYLADKACGPVVRPPGEWFRRRGPSGGYVRDAPTSNPGT